MSDLPTLVRPRPAFGRLWHRVALATAAVMVAGFLVIADNPVRTRPLNPGSLNSDQIGSGQDAAPHAVAAPDSGPAFVAHTPTWPGAATVDLDLSAGRAGVRADGSDIAGGAAAGVSVAVHAAGTPVWLRQTDGGPSRARVRVLDQGTAAKAGVDGVLVQVGALDQAGPLGVSLDYAAFAGAFGAGWADRLQIKAMPACVLTSPQRPECQTATTVPVTNNVAASTVSAKVAAPSFVGGGVVLALSGGVGGSSGTAGATSLQASSQWGAGTNTGEFTWQYPMSAPPSLGGPVPALNLSYSSGSVDGRTPAENAQPSWVGEGFEFGPGGFVERRFVGCGADVSGTSNNTAQTVTGDECWQTRNGAVAQNLTFSLGEHGGGDLIQDAANPNRWHPRTEDGSLIEHRTGGPNGDNDGEYWVLTTVDGVQYWFGGRSGSNATQTVPVYGNDPNEPCHAATFVASSCTQAYRWNLDLVRDPHGNTMAYTYATETNAYAAAGNANVLASYIRSAYLVSIDYGTRTDDPAGATPPMHVDFTVADRCDANCWSGSNPVPASWPDVPWDQSCTTTPCNDLSPAFYTAKRLAQVTTKVWNPAKTPSAGYDNVEQWTLHHSYPSPGDGTRAGLFLDRISHVGLVGMTTSVPDVTFEGQAMPNRVMPDTGDGKPGMNWERVKTITTEAGGIISVVYAPANCSSTSLPDVNNLQDNHLRCFPVHWTNPATGTTSLEFFHKYVVSSVAEADQTGGSTHSLTSYDYVGNAAWHYTDDDGLIQPTDKTWSVWRGYPTVRTTKGDPGDLNVVRTQTETTYFQGMHGDHLPSGTRSVVMPAIDMNGDGDTADQADVPASNDEDVFAGLVRRSTTLNGVSGVEVSSTASQPWRSNPTASRTINGVTVEARYVHAAASFNRVALDTDSGHRVAGWRTTSSVTAFDSLGMPLSTEDRGDDAVTGDETCHLVEYVRDATVLGATAPDANKWLMAYPKRSRDFATTCATATSPTAQLTDDDIVADNLNLYDGLALGVPPTKGDMTEARALKSWDAATQTPGYLTVSTATYDAYGRMTGATDVRGNQTTTAYTPATGGPVTGSSVTNSLGWTATTVLNPAWGASLSSTDANGRITNQAYDGLGRLTSVWDPSRNTSQPATTVYTYNLRNDAVSSVTTQALTPAGTYLSTYQLYDALLRPRQTQAADINGGGRIVSDYFYDSLGRPYLTSEPHLEPGSPGTALFVPDPGSELDVASQTKTLFDGVGRATVGISLSNGDELWRTTSSYTGDREDITPPHGGTASSEITDAQGRVVELRQYANPTPTGTSTSTRYTYNRKGQLVAVQDPAGHQWTTTYDLLGRAIAATDPDKGATSSTYNDAGDQLTSTDALGNVLAYTYDSLGRATTVRDGSATGPKRTEVVYDGLTNARGQLTKTIRYDGTDAYSMQVTGFNLSYQPTGISYTIPTTTKYPGIGGTYTYNSTYNADGSPATLRLPDVDGAGGMPLEQLTYGYNGSGAPTTLNTNLGNTTYVTGTTYTSYGEIDRITLQNNAGLSAYIQYGYEFGTRRLSEIKASRDTAPTVVTDVNYKYDDAGNTTKIKDAAVGPTADTQCLRYDNYQRLTTAWTPAADDCGTDPTAAGLGGPAPYWTSWQFDVSGNRTQQVEHATPTGDRTTSYSYPTVGGVVSHQLGGTSTVDNAGTTTAAYGYDVLGNTRSRPGVGSSNQTLTWDAEGHLTSDVDGSSTTTFLDDASGNRLVRKDSGGVTLYLPGQELKVSTAGVKSTTRYYVHAGVLVATRTTAALTWVAADQHGTANVTIAATGTQAAAVRRETPYGTLRSTTGTWPASMDKGFVGGTNDPTGLVHLGAREYDPAIGRFVSADPLLDIGDPQQMQGYSYANNRPTSAADPGGLMVQHEDSTPCDANCVAQAQAQAQVDINQSQVDSAEKTKNKPLTQVIIEAGVGFLLDFFGITDIWNCLTKGDIWACVNTLINFLPWGAIFTKVKKIVKGVTEALKAFTAWRRACEVAERVLSKAHNALDAAKSKLDDVLEKAGKDKKTAADPHAPGKDGAGGAGKEGADDAGSGGGRDDGGGSSAGESCEHSFAPTTLVKMADGTTKAIGDVKVGDKVLATDPDTGQTTVRVVTDLHINHDTDMADVVVATPTGTTVLHATQTHPFWDDTRHAWVQAGDLKPGDALRTDDNSAVQVVLVRAYTGPAVMRDLTVEGIHTYYVVASTTSVLVHNCPASVVRQKVADMKATMTKEEHKRTTYAAAHVTTAEGKTEVWVASAGKSGYARPAIRGGAKNVRSPAPAELADLPHINDAEMHLYRAAQARGATINAIGATRPICPLCQVRLGSTSIVTELK